MPIALILNNISQAYTGFSIPEPIEGLFHGGQAEQSRHRNSDFGSGYRGLNVIPSEEVVRSGGIGALPTSAYKRLFGESQAVAIPGLALRRNTLLTSIMSRDRITEATKQRLSRVLSPEDLKITLRGRMFSFNRSMWKEAHHQLSMVKAWSRATGLNPILTPQEGMGASTFRHESIHQAEMGAPTHSVFKQLRQKTGHLEDEIYKSRIADFTTANPGKSPSKSVIEYHKQMASRASKSYYETSYAQVGMEQLAYAYERDPNILNVLEKAGVRTGPQVNRELAELRKGALRTKGALEAIDIGLRYSKTTARLIPQHEGFIKTLIKTARTMSKAL